LRGAEEAGADAVLVTCSSIGVQYMTDFMSRLPKRT
jgi:hypothetical protein